MVAVPRITLYLDTVSPFAYIAYYVLRVSHNSRSLSLHSEMYGVRIRLTLCE
jgi:hypothetical protein